MVTSTTSTTCLYSGNKNECKGESGKNLTMLMCDRHLRDYYGLELGYVEFDNITHVSFVGFFLKPVKDVSIFQRYTVIIPTKQFFDKYFRPNDFALAKSNNAYTSQELENLDMLPYVMNPRIEENVRNYAKNAPQSTEHRFVIEMYRNFMDTKTDVGPNQLDELMTLQRDINSKKNHSETFITKQPSGQIISDSGVYVKSTQHVKLDGLGLSIPMQYLLSNCLCSEIVLNASTQVYGDYLPFNVMFVKNVGLVATEQIADPLYLVVDGKIEVNQIYLNAHVTPVQKTIQKTRLAIRDLPKPFAFNEVMKSGLRC